MTLIQEMSGKVLLPSAAWLTKCVITRRGGPTELSADIKAWICCSNHVSLVEEVRWKWNKRHLNRSGLSFRITSTSLTNQTPNGGAAITIKLLVSSSSGGVKCGGPPGRERPCGCATISSRLYLPPVEKGTLSLSSCRAWRRNLAALL